MDVGVVPVVVKLLSWESARSADAADSLKYEEPKVVGPKHTRRERERGSVCVYVCE